MSKRLAVLLVLAAAIAGCGNGDDRTTHVPNVDGLWRESAAVASRNDCVGIPAPVIPACTRDVTQFQDQAIWQAQCADAGSYYGSVSREGEVALDETHTTDLSGSCKLQINTSIDFFACDVGNNEASQSDNTRLIDIEPQGDCPLPPTCVGAGRGRPCASNSDCPTNGRCNLAVCIGGYDKDNTACTTDENCLGCKDLTGDGDTDDPAECDQGICSRPACVGGGNAGATCASSAECAGGSCSRPLCAGGLRDTLACDNNGDCPGGKCNGAIETCHIVMASTLTRRPGTCFGGANDGKSCVAAADCRPGTCVTTVCEAGTRNGLACAADANCPVQCVAGKCDGGPNEGANCASDAECPFYGCDNAGLQFCNTGPRNNLTCTSGSDCPCTNPADSANCPAEGSRCVPRTSCSGGTRFNQVCTTSAECPVFTCGTSVCSGGSNGGAPCLSNEDCDGGSCVDRPFCQGGERDGKTCSSGSDCPGGECFEQARPCSGDINIPS